MTTLQLQGAPVLVVGAGIMGAGIAQVAAQAGHAVQLFDAREGAAEQAKAKLASTLDGLVAKGKLAREAAAATLARITPVAVLEQAREAALVVEAIVENLEVKRGLLRQLEGLVSERCVLATNTSSISVTALAMGLVHQVTPLDGLDAAVDVAVKDLLAGGPNAQREIKALFAQLEVGPITDEVRELTAQTISRVRGTDEAREGFDAFLSKRPASWIPQ